MRLRGAVAVAAAWATAFACVEPFGSDAADAVDTNDAGDATAPAVDAAPPPEADGGVLVDPDADLPRPPDGQFPPACALDVDLNKVTCAGFSMPTCGSRLAGYPNAREGDLVDCTGGKARCIRHCPSGCVMMRTNVPDFCDDCANRGNGWYCGKDLRGVSDASADDALQCENGKAKSSAVCGVGKCASQCPTPIDVNGARPACCIP